jgi:glycerophosphoryl diester phosphodiesterase
VGKLVKDLTVAQLKTLDRGTRRPPDPTADPFVDTQIPVPGSRMLTLREVLELVQPAATAGPGGTRLNIETKIEAATPAETAPREQFVQVTVAEVRRAGLVAKVSIQSFVWAALRRVREVEPGLRIVALVEEDILQVGQPGASPWLGGIDIDAFAGDPVQAAASLGPDALSPVHGYPQDGSVLDPGYRPFTTKAMIERAHAAGMKVIPWTVDDIATMNDLINAGVDGLITDYPDRLRDLLRSRGRPPPPPFGSGGK